MIIDSMQYYWLPKVSVVQKLHLCLAIPLERFSTGLIDSRRMVLPVLQMLIAPDDQKK